MNHPPYKVSNEKTHMDQEKSQHSQSNKLYIAKALMCTVICFSKVGIGWDSESSHCSRAFISEPDSNRVDVKAESSADP